MTIKNIKTFMIVLNNKKIHSKKLNIIAEFNKKKLKYKKI